MRKPLAALLAVFILTLLVAAPVAQAATNVNVRIEGKEETLFESTIPVSIQKVKSPSDTQERDCDGINELDPENVVPKITPTLASVEAMSSIGETFDGQWYEEPFSDYFITRWGPDSQDTVAGAYWGILVNEVYTNVGGCQFQLDEDDEVLWIWDAFKGRPTLALYPDEAHYSAGPRPVTAIAELGQPFGVEVVSFPDGGEGIPGEGPSRAGSSAYAGAEVAPVTTSAKGFQRIDTASPQTVKTNAQGKAAIVFTEPGIHRIKATVGAPGKEKTVVRSNRLDVCVPAAFGDCGEKAPPQPAPPTTGEPKPAAARIGAPKLDRSKLAQGKVGVSWKVLDAGSGITGWRVSAKRLGARGAKFVVRASGRKGTRATVSPPPGATYRLRLTLSEVGGGTIQVGLGKVTVPGAPAH